MEKQVRFRHSILSYDIRGAGHPLLLLHGFGEDRRIWQLQADALHDHAMLIVPDLPGSGHSGLPSSPNGFLTLEDHAEALLAILDHEGIERCTLIGHSMGGYIALAFAERWPERLQAFGLFHSTAAADSPEKREARARGIDFVRQHGAGRFLAEVIPNLYSDGFKSSHPESVATHIAQSQAFSVDAVAGYYTAMMQRPDRTSVLQNFAKPVLFIMGEADKTVLLRETLPQAALPKESHVHIFPSVAHMGMRENPSETNTVLRAFLSHVNEN
jgi:pimeloyl-ACP methyl ester carboxylesterase